MLTEQAKIFNNQLDTPVECDFSQGWLSRLTSRHGVLLYSMSGDKLPVHKAAADKFVYELVSDEKVISEQVYNADETGLYTHSFSYYTFFFKFKGKLTKHPRSGHLQPMLPAFHSEQTSDNALFPTLTIQPLRTDVSYVLSSNTRLTAALYCIFEQLFLI
ncbi:hypothetical protein PR048_002202 [Dryococelus australis]|uniref:HTH CENPB-type domain-containing protein n=1 Tax=Dryococelus australis TaxID=614101 RepID=A0ABQ9IKL3_9NEOP|nr:hypothetical protein PR048_002202 [Dryococelus australis]